VVGPGFVDRSRRLNPPAFPSFNDAGGQIVGFSDYKNVAAWLERGLARPAVQKGLNIPPRP